MAVDVGKNAANTAENLRNLEPRCISCTKFSPILPLPGQNPGCPNGVGGRLLGVVRFFLPPYSTFEMFHGQDWEQFT
jgi:hypothetical protein